VPANLVIVGTMNTADRSIQLLDSALRRRFKFEELLPDYDVIKSEKAQIILKGINDRIRCLLNKDYQIGHSYLMFADNDCDILSALYNKIIPLIEEYFYNDMSKVRFILGDKDNAANNFYLIDDMAKKAHNRYMSNEIDADDREFYTLNTNIKIAIDELDEIECGKYLVNLL
jgi:5-methylcytosine-specific restriction protein B